MLVHNLHTAYTAHNGPDEEVQSQKCLQMLTLIAVTVLWVCSNCVLYTDEKCTNKKKDYL